jgi:hypothetical protein
MSTSPQFNLSAFPHKVLDPIATLTSPPTCASIKLAQRQLSANAAAIPSLNGGGAHGHMALTLTPAAYSDLTDVPFVIPVAPPADPVPGTIQPQIAENNRIHQRDIAVHSLYVAVNNALRQQLLDAIPRVYVREIEHEIYAYSHITCLDLLTHLWTTYGTISATDLKENIQSMYKPWNPADPIETVFHQLADAIRVLHCRRQSHHRNGCRASRLQRLRTLRSFSLCLRKLALCSPRRAHHGQPQNPL